MLSGWIHQVPSSVHVLLAILSWKRDISTSISISKYIKVYATILRILCVIMIFDKGTPFTFSYTWWKAKSGKFGHCSFWISPLGVAFQQALPIRIEMRTVLLIFFRLSNNKYSLHFPKSRVKRINFESNYVFMFGQYDCQNISWFWIFHLSLKWPSLGKPSCKKSAVFFNIVQKAFDTPPPFIWTFVLFCRGCFLKRVFEHLI